jgi:hypothetical protein
MRRRTFFGLVGAGAVGAAVMPLSGVATRARPVAGARVATLDFLLAPLVGRPLPGGFRVSSIGAVERGSARIGLTHQDGTEVAVQVFRRSPRSSGLATTRLLDLRWMNGGDGARATHETAGLAVMNLAARIRRIEGAIVGLSPAQRASLGALYTHEHRSVVHGGFEVAETETA